MIFATGVSQNWTVDTDFRVALSGDGIEYLSMCLSLIRDPSGEIDSVPV